MGGEASYSPEAIVAMLLFSLASSSLLLVNKLCVHYLPVPAFISTLQFISAMTTSMVLMAGGFVPVDHFDWQKVRPYLLYVCMFVATIYANMRALQHSNVETIIVFRACCPLVVCILDWGFLGRTLPSCRSVVALLVLVGGCAGYVLTDKAFLMNGWAAYSWVSAYFLIISVEMAYGKHITGPHLNFASMWGPTMYTNTLSIPPMLTIGLLAHEHDKLLTANYTSTALCLVAVSCVIGVAISYLGWRARSLVTATCYTVLGVANKMATVLANTLLWDQHASLPGIACLVVCLLGAAAYKQAPMADTSDPNSSRYATRRKKGLFLLGGALAVIAAAGFSLHTPIMPPSVPGPFMPPSAAPTAAPTVNFSSKSTGHPSTGHRRKGLANHTLTHARAPVPARLHHKVDHKVDHRRLKTINKGGNYDAAAQVAAQADAEVMAAGTSRAAMPQAALRKRAVVSTKGGGV